MFLSYDELKGELLSLEVPPQKDCPVCSVDGGVIGLGDLKPLPGYEGKMKAIRFPDQFVSQALKNT